MRLATKINLVMAVIFLLALLLASAAAYWLAVTTGQSTEPASGGLFWLLLPMAAGFLFLFIGLNLALRRLVLKPVAQATRMADETANGNLKIPDIKVTGDDEIADMLHAFNRMRRNVIKIVQVAKKLKAQVKANS